MLRILAAAIGVVAVLLWPAAVQAHDGADAFVHVPLDHIVVNQAFPVTVSDFPPATAVVLRLTVDDAPVTLGAVTTDQDGHGQESFRLPAGSAPGYLELTASADDGTTASTWVRVGDDPLASQDGGRWHLDGWILVAAAIAVPGLIVIAILATLLRRRA